MRSLLTITTLLLVTITILLALLGTFQEDAFYDYAYRANGVYDSLGEHETWLVTENFQSYIVDDASLNYFVDDEASHLEDVKGLYVTGVVISRILLALLAVLLFSFGYSKERKALLSKLFRKTGIVLFVTIGIVGLLSLSWEWFFTLFHRLFFSGNWVFARDTLMIQLWGGNFFPLAASYILIKSVLLAGVFLLLAKIISRR